MSSLGWNVPYMGQTMLVRDDLNDGVLRRGILAQTMFDTGSEVELISHAFIQRVGLSQLVSPLSVPHSVSGIGGGKVLSNEEIKLSWVFNSDSLPIDLSCYVVDIDREDFELLLGREFLHRNKLLAVQAPQSTGVIRESRVRVNRSEDARAPVMDRATKADGAAAIDWANDALKNMMDDYNREDAEESEAKIKQSLMEQMESQPNEPLEVPKWQHEVTIEEAPVTEAEPQSLDADMNGGSLRSTQEEAQSNPLSGAVHEHRREGSDPVPPLNSPFGVGTNYTGSTVTSPDPGAVSAKENHVPAAESEPQIPSKDSVGLGVTEDFETEPVKYPVVLPKDDQNSKPKNPETLLREQLESTIVEGIADLKARLEATVKESLDELRIRLDQTLKFGLAAIVRDDVQPTSKEVKIIGVAAHSVEPRGVVELPKPADSFIVGNNTAQPRASMETLVN